MHRVITTLLALTALFLASAASAEDRVLEFWMCTLKEGKTLEDAATINGKWLKLQNDANPGAKIRSWGLTSIVGEPNAFGYMDSFPNLEAWAKAKAVIESAEGQALDAEFGALADCTRNRLYQATEH